MNFYILNQNEELITILSTDEGESTAVQRAVVEEKLRSYDLLTLEIPADSEEAGLIMEDYYVIFKDVKGWREYIISTYEDIDGENITLTLTAELSSIELLDEVLEAELSNTFTDPEELLEEALEGTRWEVGLVDPSIYNRNYSEKTIYKNLLEFLEDVTKFYDCEVQFSYEVTDNRVTHRKVNLYKQFGENKGKRFEVEKDINEIKRTIDTTNIKTAILPYKFYEEEDENGERVEKKLDITGVEWKVANGDPINKPLGQNWLGNPESLALWGKKNPDGSRRHRKISMEIDVATPEALISMAWVQLNRYTVPKTTYEVKAVDLYTLTGDEDLKHEYSNLGDTVVAIDRYFARPIIIQTRVVEIKRDLLEPLNNEFVFGDSKSNFSTRDVAEKVEAVDGKIGDVKDRIEEVNRKVLNVQENLNGKTKTYRGSEQPTGMTQGDIWFRPNPTVAGEKQMLVYNGSIWEIQADTADLQDAGRLRYGIIDATEINVINLTADDINGGRLNLAEGLVIGNGATDVLKINASTGQVEMNVSKMTINYAPVATQEDLENIELTPGKSAYEIAVEAGYKGTEAQWLESLKGQDGSNGTAGEKGADGKTSYIHIAYATSADGSQGFSTTVSASKTYIGQYTDFVEEDSEDYRRYTWSKFKGEDGYTPVKGTDYFDGKDGQDGSDGDSSFLWVRYSQNANGNPMTDSPTDAKYVGLATTNTSTAPTAYSAYKWSLVKGTDGINGEKGSDGQTSYLHIKYSNDGGATFTANNGETVGEWIGTYVDFTKADSTSVSKYTWNKVKGDKGEKGDTGPKGATGSQGPRGNDGTSVSNIVEYYLATSASSGVTTSTSGWGTTLQPITASKRYLWNYEKINFSDGTSQNTIPVIIGVYGDKGEEGDVGRSITAIKEHYLVSASSSGVTRATSGWSETMKVTTETLKYLWNYETITWNKAPFTTYVEPIIIGVHGAKGSQGPQGIQGPKGDNGQSQYTHIRYSANSNGSSMTTSPSSTTKYIGIAVTNSASAPAYTSFTWSKYIGEDGSQGPQGPQGVRGPAGANGQPTYTWVKYANDKNGGGMSDYPEGKRFIGLAFNKTTQTESTTASHYQWSEMPQNIEIGGRNLLKNSDREVSAVGGREFVQFADLAPIFDEYGVDEVYSLSLELKSSNVSNRSTIQVYMQNGIGTKYNFVNTSVSVTTEYQRFKFEGLKPSLSSPTETKAWLAFYGTYDSGNFPIIRRVKVEKGNKATDWTEAPEDVQEQINGKADNELISGLEDALNDLDEVVKELGVDTLKSQLEAYQATLSTVEADATNAKNRLDQILSEENGELVLINNVLDALNERWTTLDGFIEINGDQTSLSINKGSVNMVIDSKSLTFYSGGSAVATITNQYMKIDRGIFVESMHIGRHQFSPLASNRDHFVLNFVGDPPE